MTENPENIYIFLDLTAPLFEWTHLIKAVEVLMIKKAQQVTNIEEFKD
jgi:CMP-N-acetylneuraminic acid synthetase